VEVKAAYSSCLLFCLMRELPRDLSVVSCRASWPGRAASAVAKQPHIYFQLINRAAQGVAVHPELTRRATLIAFVLLQDCGNKTALKFAYRFGIKDIAAVHLLYQRFKLIFHGSSLSMTVLVFATVAKSNLKVINCYFAVAGAWDLRT
jgi:hypothetical protein